MADIVPDLDTLAGHRASARHAAPRPDQPYENATRGRFLRTAHVVFYPFRARPVKPRAGSFESSSGREPYLPARSADGDWPAATKVRPNLMPWRRLQREP